MIFCRIVLSHSNGKSRRGTVLCFTTFWYRKVLCTLWGEIKFSVEFFWLTVLRVFVGKPFSVSLLSDISIIFIHRRGISQYFVEFFCLTLAKQKSDEPIGFPGTFGHQKKFCMRGGISCFSVEKTLSHSAKKLRGDPFCVSLLPGIGEFCAQEGYNTILCRLFFTHIAENFRRQTI